MAADQELQQLNDALRKLEANIQSVEEKIDQASTEILTGGGPAIDSPAVKYWISEKEQLRKKELLLLELRLVEAKGGKYLLICWRDRSKVLPSLMVSVLFRCERGEAEVHGGRGEGAFDERNTRVERDATRIQQEEQRGKAFSVVSSICAEKLLGAIGIIEMDGRAMDPLIVPMDAPSYEGFDYSKYDNEDSGMHDLMEHHKTQLARFEIPFGFGGYAMYDLHSKGTCFRFLVNGQLYHGTTDCSSAPYGLLGESPARLLRIGFVHKKPKESVNVAFAF